MRRRGPGGPVGHPSSHLSRGLRLPTPSLRYLENEMRIISKSHVQTQFLPSFYSCHAGVAESTASFPSLWFSISLLAFLHRLPISYCECGLCTTPSLRKNPNPGLPDCLSRRSMVLESHSGRDSINQLHNAMARIGGIIKVRGDSSALISPRFYTSPLAVDCWFTQLTCHDAI